MEVKTPVQMSEFARTQYESKYAMTKTDGSKETWDETAFRVCYHNLSTLGYTPESEEFQKLLGYITDRKFIPGGRYLYASGRDLHQTQNCLLLRCEDSREGWASLYWKATMALSTGAGIGIDYSDVRPDGTPIKRTGGVASGPLPVMNTVNEIGRGIVQGGSRRSAIWAGLNWKHGDIYEFIKMKDWDEDIKERKSKDFFYPAQMDMTNISVLLDDEFFAAFHDNQHPDHFHAVSVYWSATTQMLAHGEPGFSIDVGENAGETLRNACTEVTSRDDSDVCNLGSINLGRIESKSELEDVTRYATLFLLSGTVYSDLPYDKVSEIREKNRRLGLGLMGVHEWLIKHGYSYEPNDELAEWLTIWEDASDEFSERYALEHGLSVPIARRALAPNGTIGIIGETTTGIEPILTVAYKRTYVTGRKSSKYQYVVDPTARRAVDKYGINPNEIEDSVLLSYQVERRMEFQAWIQQWVDQGISSTINLPYPVTNDAEVDAFGETLIEYLPKLRGITCYPDGARSGQPIIPVPYEFAIQEEGVVFEEDDEKCKGGLCGV